MIQPTELRIGNKVLIDGVVNTISQLNTSVCHVMTPQGNEIYSAYTFIKPIPLTEEWLLRFGFEKQNNGWNKNDFGLFDYNYCKGKLNLKLNACECPLPYVKYVHQLQNLFFALTSTELTLK